MRRFTVNKAYRKTSVFVVFMSDCFLMLGTALLSPFVNCIMTRDDINDEVINTTAHNILCEFPTGLGKSKLAIDFIKKRHKKGDKILIVIPKLVLIDNWKDEFKKWGASKLLNSVTFTTYVSFSKHIGHWTFQVIDECFRGDTEILTEKGYIRFDELTNDIKVAQWNDDNSIEFVNPIRLIKNPYNGELKKVHLGRDRYVYMTPRHNQVYSTKTCSKWKVKPIKDLAASDYYYIPVSGIGTGENNGLTPLERVYIAIQADGTLQRHQKNESVYSIQLTKERKKERFLKLIENSDKFNEIKVKRPNTRRWMCKLPKGNAKLLSTHFNLNMGYDRAQDFINEILQWDGSYLAGNTAYYSSKIKENADFVAAVAVQAGYKVLQSTEEDSRKASYSTIHRVFMRKVAMVGTQPMAKSSYIQYNGYVYCVEVPSHKIVVRSDGYTFVSGNCHHLTERCYEALSLPEFKADYSILLSATVGYKKLWDFKVYFRNLKVFKIGIRKAIENEILPDPKVYLIPLTLNNVDKDVRVIETDRKTGKTVVFYYTEQQYYNKMCNLINYFKPKSNSKTFMDLYLHECGKRLKWLSNMKQNTVYNILKILDKERTLTFCSSIEQTELLGKYCINSKNKISGRILEMFNIEKINHITSCNILDEGANIKNCRVGVFAMINSSERMQTQKVGRLLRHKDPVIIIPYYANTREEEIVLKMTQNYNPQLITTIKNIKDLKI